MTMNINLTGVNDYAAPSSLENEKKAKISGIDKEVDAVFKLSPPFHSRDTVNIDELDFYSQTTFRELIQAQTKEELPFFLALTKDIKEKIEISDGAAFIRNYFWQDRKTSPLTRTPIQEARIYQIDHLKDQAFKSLGDLSTLKQNNDHLIKFINACDPNLNPSMRGQERFYMGFHCENGLETSPGKWLVEPDLKKAFFWYKKSMEDRYFGAPIALVDWYETGNQEVKPSDEQVFQNLKLAAEWVPPNDPHAPEIYEGVCTCYEETGQKLCSREEINKYRVFLENAQANKAMCKSF